MTSNTVIGTKDVLVFGNNKYGQLGLADKDDRPTPQYLMKNENIVQIICGVNFTIILKECGEILVIGCYTYGTCEVRSCILTPLTPLTPLVLNKHVARVVQIACGNSHTMILTLDGDVFSFGNNLSGQLGLGHDISQKNPQQVETSDWVIKIASGHDHSAIITNNYEIFMFGRNMFGQLGLGHNKNQYSPKLLMKNEKISKIVCGWAHTIILNDDGQVFICGEHRTNPHSRVGQFKEDRDDQNKPQLLKFDNDKNIVQVASDDNTIIFLADNGQVWLIGKYSTGPKLLLTDKSIVQITCGNDHVVFLKDNGELLVYGSNLCGQLGLDDLAGIDIPELLMDGVTMIFNTVDLLKWTPVHHRYFSYRFREKVWVFLLALKRFQRVTRISVPKFIRFEFFKQCV